MSRQTTWTVLIQIWTVGLYAGFAMAADLPLSQSEVDDILAMEQVAVSSFQQRDLYARFAKVTGILAGSPHAKEEYVTGMSVYPDSSAAGRNATAIVSRYVYEKGLTLQTTIDLKQKKVLKVEALSNYPTPLAPAELANAIKLARQKNLTVNQLVSALTDDEIKPDALVLHADNPSDPKRGHRLVRLSFLNPEISRRRTSVIVDLTDGSVVPD